MEKLLSPYVRDFLGGGEGRTVQNNVSIWTGSNEKIEGKGRGLGATHLRVQHVRAPQQEPHVPRDDLHRLLFLHPHALAEPLLGGLERLAHGRQEHPRVPEERLSYLGLVEEELRPEELVRRGELSPLAEVQEPRAGQHPLAQDGPADLEVRLEPLQPGLERAFDAAGKHLLGEKRKQTAERSENHGVDGLGFIWDG